MRAALARAFAHGLFVLSALTVGCRGQKVVHRPGEEALREIRIEGNTSIESKVLREGLALRRVQNLGAPPDPYVVDMDGERIRGEYWRRGFFEVDVHSRVERSEDATTVTYTIAEGPRAKTRVTITGLPPGEPELAKRVRDAFPLVDGDPFAYEPYETAKDRLLAIVEDAGYAHAQLDGHVVVDRAARVAVVHLEYTLGTKATFGEVDIIGVGPELAESVRARVAFGRGDSYSTSAISETERRIYDLGRFSLVRVLSDKTKNDVIDVRITLSRSARNELSLGGGLGMDPATYEVRGRAGYTVLGWPFTLTDFEVDLRPAYAMLRDGGTYEPRVRAMTRLRRIDLFRPFVVGEVEAGYNYLTVEAYTSYGPHARLGVETPLGWSALKIRAGWGLERLDFREISPLIGPALQADLRLDETQRVGQYTQALALDLRDDPFDPRLGAYAEVHVDEGTPYAGGAVTFLRVTPELRGYVPVPHLPIVLAARARVGRIYGDLPATERYFSGGSGTQRGFAERHLAPTITGEIDGEMRSVPIGGAELVETSLELRAKLGQVKGVDVGGVVFLDGGDVVDRGQRVEVGNLHWAAGLGLRLFTAVGAVRADVGYRLNRTGAAEPAPDSSYAFHISIGEAY